MRIIWRSTLKTLSVVQTKLFFYKTRGGAEIDLVVQHNKKIIGIECTTSIDISEYKQRGMKSFLKKYPKAHGYIIAPVQQYYKILNNLHVIPWTQIA